MSGSKDSQRTLHEAKMKGGRPHEHLPAVEERCGCVLGFQGHYSPARLSGEKGGTAVRSIEVRPQGGRRNQVRTSDVIHDQCHVAA